MTEHIPKIPLTSIYHFRYYHNADAEAAYLFHCVYLPFARNGGVCVPVKRSDVRIIDDCVQKKKIYIYSAKRCTSNPHVKYNTTLNGLRFINYLRFYRRNSFKQTSMFTLCVRYHTYRDRKQIRLISLSDIVNVIFLWYAERVLWHSLKTSCVLTIHNFSIFFSSRSLFVRSGVVLSIICTLSYSEKRVE